MCVYVCVREDGLYKHVCRLLLALERIKVDAVLREAYLQHFSGFYMKRLHIFLLHMMRCWQTLTNLCYRISFQNITICENELANTRCNKSIISYLLMIISLFHFIHCNLNTFPKCSTLSCNWFKHERCLKSCGLFYTLYINIISQKKQ